jgi:hypothetical protein
MTSLILIKDIINNKESIYNTNFSNSFHDCIQYLKNTCQLDNINYFIHNTFCEIFIENQTLQKGWIWNSTETTKQVIYILSFVPILDTQPKMTVNTETQTMTTSCQTVSTQTTSDLSPLELQYRYYNNQDRLFEHFDIQTDTYTYTNNNNTCVDPLQICKRPEQKSSPILDILTKELKSKLQLPNYGLKTTNYHFDLI